ncbi:hypothetical protein AB0F96_35240 [Streptomyces sp. NPDC023998]|uniref:Kae1-like domain-containing protein n=1 Tax=Streptomyces sp. NPDC023998 TaxID=3154597 RepID=UPI0033D03107
MEGEESCPAPHAPPVSRASSAGRLFDAAASLLGLGDEASYEGQAAVALEAAAGDIHTDALPWRLVRADGLWAHDPVATLTALLEELASGVPLRRIAAAFHATVAEATAALVDRTVAAGAPRTVCLSGGCFQNRGLLTAVRTLLRAQGLRVLVGSAVPVNDGGISYGRAAVAAARLAKAKGRARCIWAFPAGSLRPTTPADCARPQSTSAECGARCARSTPLGPRPEHTS